jgi:peptide chain release factor 3
MTENLLLFGGAIQLAGEVKASSGGCARIGGGRAHGTSVSPAVMSFEHRGLAFNLLDTPGHWDFGPRNFNPLGF